MADDWTGAGLSAREVAIFKDLIGVVGDVLAEALKQRDGRIAALEARIAMLEQRKAFAYCGIWDEAEQYREGDFVTHSGSLWHCDSRITRARPGTSLDWQLAVKRGRAA